MQVIQLHRIPETTALIRWPVTTPEDANFDGPRDKRFLQKSEMTPEYWEGYRRRRESARVFHKGVFLDAHPDAKIVKETEHIIVFAQTNVTTFQALEIDFLCDDCIDNVIFFLSQLP